jgi:multiple sugar transport system permease protein
MALDLAQPLEVAAYRRRAGRRHLLGRIALYAFVLLTSLLAAGPFVWSTITAFKSNADLYNVENNPYVFNDNPTWENIKFLLTGSAFPTFLWNTIWVGIAVVLITLVLGLPAAYSLARLGGRWSGVLGIAIFLVYLVPPTLLFLPMTRVIAFLGLQDNTWSLVLVYPTFTLPVSVWLMMGFLRAIPKDLEEQAMVDGYSRLGAFLRAVVPLAVPGIVAVVVFAFTVTASEFIYALAFISPTSDKVLSTGVPTELIRGDVFQWQSLQAASVFVAVPIALAFNVFLNRFITGFTMGAVKG